MKKRKDDNFEKNISRLVKQAGDDKPISENLKNRIIDEALAELDRPAGNARQERKTNMKMASFIKTLSAIAAVLIIGGIAFTIMTPKLSRVNRLQKRVVMESEQKQRRLDKQMEAEFNRDKKQAAKKIKSGPAAASESVQALTEPEMPQPPVLGDVKEDMSAARDRVRVSGAPVIGKRFEAADKEKLCYNYPAPAVAPHMAHGGTTPPNGEMVDAQFFQNYGVNPFIDAEDDNLSTFATDVDTGSYTIARRYLHNGMVPPKDAVRVEEFVNYFDYGYAAPQEETFAVYTEGSQWPFADQRKNNYLLRIALKAKQVGEQNRKPAILTFVIDVSGSMGRENRLGLVKRSLRLLLDKLNAKDRVGIAVYGSQGRKVLDHTGLENKDTIISAIESLHTEGATNAEEGLRIGYDMADREFVKGYTNRVILCSDGVANVGRTGAEQLYEMIKSKADKGITLSSLGFGMGNYNDVLLEQLGNKGNGSYAYVDTIEQARELFAGITTALEVVARDVKVQVEFNPDVVRSYRLIGYENRDVPDDKFRDDKQDGGEMNAGHSATAVYELKLWPGKKGKLCTTFVRYKDPVSFDVTEFKSTTGTDVLTKPFDETVPSFRLAAIVSQWAEVLRESPWAKDTKLENLLTMAQGTLNEYPGNNQVIELVDLVARTKSIADNTSDEKPQPVEYIEPRAE